MANGTGSPAGSAGCSVDYLIKVKELPFTEAVERIAGYSEISTSVSDTPPKPKAKTLLLLEASQVADRVIRYLTGRGSDRERQAVFFQHSRQIRKRYPASL